MRQFITGHAVANAVRMKRTVHAGAFLVVEGATDKSVYGIVIDEETCIIEIGHGRHNVIDAVEILNQEGFPGVAAIIDADMDYELGSNASCSNIFVTDWHDLECVLLDSPAFDRVLEELGSASRISAFARATPLIAQQLAKSAMLLGHLRLISLRDGINLKFEGLKFSKFVDADSLAIDEQKMIKEVLNNSSRHDLAVEHLQSKISVERVKGHHCWIVSCGHDILEVLSLALRKSFSAKRANDVTAENLHRYLRLAFNAEHLRQTMLYQKLACWEQENSPYVILTHA